MRTTAALFAIVTLAGTATLADHWDWPSRDAIVESFTEAWNEAAGIVPAGDPILNTRPVPVIGAVMPESLTEAQINMLASLSAWEEVADMQYDFLQDSWARLGYLQTVYPYHDWGNLVDHLTLATVWNRHVREWLAYKIELIASLQSEYALTQEWQQVFAFNVAAQVPNGEELPAAGPYQIAWFMVGAQVNFEQSLGLMFVQ